MFWRLKICPLGSLSHTQLPVVTHAEMTVLLKANQAFIESGTLWNEAKWSKELGRKLPLFDWTGPTKVLPEDHQEFTEDPQVSFAAMSSPEFLKESSVALLGCR